MRRYLPSFANLAVSLLFYPVSLLLVNVYFTAQERGVYFSLTGFIVIQLFFDLGIVQASVTTLSRELAGSKRGGAGSLAAEIDRGARVNSVLFHAHRWLKRSGWWSLAVVAALGCLIMIPGGVAISIWGPAVVSLMFGVAMTLWMLPIQIAVEGANEVEALGKARMLGNFARTLTLAGGIVAFPSVAWLGISMAVQAFVCAWACPRESKLFLKRGRKFAEENEGSVWQREVIPFQRRLAVSWVGGSMVSLPLVPVCLVALGAESAGRFGLTITAFQAVVAIAVLWQTVSMPRMAGLVVEAGSGAAFTLWRREFGRSVATFGILSVAFAVAVALSPVIYDVRDRVVSPAEIGWLGWGFLCTLLIYSYSYVMRAHKTEPYVHEYLLWAGLSGAGLIVGGVLQNRVALCAGYALAATLAALLFYRRFRLEARRLRGQSEAVA